jgi:hypothetical protein
MERYSTRTAASARTYLTCHEKMRIIAMLAGIKKPRLLLRGSGLGSGVGVFLGESLDASRGVDQLLFASEKGMATRADFHP